MAARENQGYLIAVILLVLVCLVLVLFTFWGMTKSQEYSDAKLAAEKEASVNKALADAYKVKSDVLSAYAGLDGTTVDRVPTLIGSFDLIRQRTDPSGQTGVDQVRDSVQAIGEVYKKDMAVNASAASGDGAGPDQTWKGTIANLLNIVRKKHNDLYVKDNESKRIQADADAEITTSKNKMEELQKNLQLTQDALAEAKRLAAQNEEQLRAKLEANQNNLQKVTGDFDNFRGEAAKKVSDLNLVIDGVRSENTSLKVKVNKYEREVFDLPDGKVVKVAPKSRTAFLDLGFDDGLRVNRTFAVYDQTVNNFEKDRHKAMVEVTRIVGAHSCEAKVTLEDPNNPILTGDFVLTATWDPGYSTPIALAGVFDLDNDGFADQDKLIQMIKRNGGNVVASHDANGNITGSIDASTRYLVMGSPPKEGDNFSGIVLAMKALEDQASGSTVQVIDTRKLLNWMGVHGKGKVERLDNQIGDRFQNRSPSNR